MFTHKLRKSIFLLSIILLANNVFAQKQLQMPSHSYNYTGAVRGYWFTAPIDFTIVGLRVPSQSGSGSQNIEVIRIKDNTPVVYPTSSTNFTSLKYIKGATNGVIQQVNIPISKGDKIGVFGTAGTSNSYGNANSVSADIDGNSVTLARILYQGHITGSSIPNYSTEPASSNISRVELYYETCNTEITSDPQPMTVCEEQKATFSAGAKNALTYQWQVDEGSGFNDVSNSSVYSGAKSSMLEIAKTPYYLNSYEFRCIAFNGASCSDTSAGASLTVNGLVKLEDLPANDTGCVDGSKDLEVKGTGSITGYRWQIYDNNTNQYIDVPQNATYTHNGNILSINKIDDTLDGAKFRAIVTGLCDNSTSTDLVLSALQIPEVAVAPVDKNVKHGSDVFFSVQSSTPNAKYQWQVATSSNTGNFVNINDGGIYQGSRTNRLKVFGASRVQHQYRFRCVIRTASDCVAPGDTSEFALLTVEPPTSVATLPANESLVVYPNPSEGSEFFIRLDGTYEKGMQYQITDKLGRVFKTDILTGEKTSINISTLPAEVYIVHILDKNNKPVARTKFTRL